MQTKANKQPNKSKQQRHKTILGIIQSANITTQAQLTDALAKAGFPAAQATISRDVRELGLAKHPMGQHYVTRAPGKKSMSALWRVFREGLVHVDYAGNMLVLRTVSGMAGAVAMALDEMGHSEILGSVAGDDVVMCVIKSEALAKALAQKLQHDY